MKRFLLSIIFLLTTLSCFSQRSFIFYIDENRYSLGEKDLNDLFGKSFNKLVESRWTTQNDYQIWVESFDKWKDAAAGGVFTYKTYYDRIAETNFTGEIPPEYLGWRAPGKSAKGNPNKKSNVSRRMSFINIYLSRALVYHFTNKVIVN